MTQTSGDGGSSRGSITVDQLIVLNDELRALVQAGIPLELGLRGSASRIGGRLGKVAEQLAFRIEQGESLVDALTEEQTEIPATYRAVLLTGLQSGRLTDVLEHVSQFAVAMRDLRSQLVRSLVYPISLLVFAYILLIAMVQYFTPWLRDAYEGFGIDESWLLSLMNWLHTTLWIWAPGIPAVGLAALVIDRFRNRGGELTQIGIARFVPGIRQVVRKSQLARFSYALAILTESRTPLPTALRLSAQGTGDGALVRSVGHVAARLEAGSSLTEALESVREIPGLLRWFMAVGQQQSRLPATLRQSAQIYREQATILAGWIQHVVPTVLVLGFGGAVCLVYATALFVPMTTLWKNIVH